MIATLAITLMIESAVIAAYALLRKKPLLHLLFSSICANLFTQPLLWAVLNLFPRSYISMLFISEIGIWGMEALILYFYPYNRLKPLEAMLLSLVMNLVSFGIGWVLPV